MPSLSIDGREVSVPDRTTVIQAAEKLGIFIPRYCYHPGLSIAGDMEGTTICVFADAAAWPVQSYITKFRDEFEEYIRSGRTGGRKAAACSA